MDVWGEIIKTIGIAMVLAIAMLSVSALAGCDGNGVLEMGAFETEESMLKFPAGQDTNIDSLEVGNDKALAYGSIFMRTPKASATNNLEVLKTQNSGACPAECCNETFLNQQTADRYQYVENCSDCCIKVNAEKVKVGNRDALAFGYAAASNNVKICTDQQ